MELLPPLFFRVFSIAIILFGIVCVYKFSILKIHYVVRFWIVCAASIIVCLIFGIAVSAVGYVLYYPAAIEAIWNDPSGAIDLFVGTGGELAAMSVLVVPVAALLFEFSHFKGRYANSQAKDWKAWVVWVVHIGAILVGPIYLFLAFFLTDLNYLERYLPEAILVSILSSFLAILAAWIIAWCMKNPSAAIHRSTGFQRLSVIMLSIGPIWLVYQVTKNGLNSFAGNLLHSDFGYAVSIGVYLGIALYLSLLAWAICNVMGWIMEGFRKQA